MNIFGARPTAFVFCIPSIHLASLKYNYLPNELIYWWREVWRYDEIKAYKKIALIVNLAFKYYNII